MQFHVRRSLSKIDSTSALDRAAKLFDNTWCTLPWQLTDFCLGDLQVLTQMRLCMFDQSRVVTEILCRADWGQVSELISSNNMGELTTNAWTEISAIIIQLTVMFSDNKMPQWLLTNGVMNQEVLLKLLAQIDWNYFHNICCTHNASGPWIIRPYTFSAHVERSGASARLTRASKLLLEACKIGFPKKPNCQAISIALDNSLGLIGLSICHGWNQSDMTNTPGSEDEPMLVYEIPTDIPVELLEGTVELEAIHRQKQQLLERPLSSAEDSDVIEILKCFKLSAYEQYDLLREALDLLLTFQEGVLIGKDCYRYSNHGLIFYDASEYFSLGSSQLLKSRENHEKYSDFAGLFLSYLVGEPCTVVCKLDCAVGDLSLPWDEGAAVFLNSSVANQQTINSSNSSQNLFKRLFSRDKGEPYPSISEMSPRRINDAVTDLQKLRLLFINEIVQSTVIQSASEMTMTPMGRCIISKCTSEREWLSNTHAMSLVETMLRRLFYSAECVESDLDDLELFISRTFATCASYLPQNSPEELLEMANNESFRQCCLLTAIFSIEARHRTTVLEKYEWQNLVVMILQISEKCHPAKVHSLELILVWLCLLDWLNDTRWRRLPPGTQVQLKRLIVLSR